MEPLGLGISETTHTAGITLKKNKKKIQQKIAINTKNVHDLLINLIKSF
jgi:hypothetical protein